MATLYLWGKPINHSLNHQAGIAKEIEVDANIKKVSCGDRHCVIMCEDKVYGIGDNC